MSSKPSLTLKRRLNAPPSKVYGAWTDSAKIWHWFGPEDAEILRAETDVRVGGRFRIVFRGPDGQEHDVGGIYREVVPDQKLVFTWAWEQIPPPKKKPEDMEDTESLITVQLIDHGNSTEMIFTHENFTTAKVRDSHQKGWDGCFDVLEKVLAA